MSHDDETQMSHDDELAMFDDQRDELEHDWYSRYRRTNNAIRKTFLTWLERDARDGNPRSKLFLAFGGIVGFCEGMDDPFPLNVREASLWASQAALAEDADVARLAKMIKVSATASLDFAKRATTSALPSSRRA